MLEMLSEELKTTIYVSVAGVLSAGASSIISTRSNKHKDDLSEHLQLRKELREELDTVKEELARVIAALDDWKEKYYSILQTLAEVRIFDEPKKDDTDP